MKISIVIPAYNEEKLLGSTLVSIAQARQAFDELRWVTEVIVCDNNSTDRTADVARDAGATVVFEPINQIGRARNTGATAATGEWLIFVDADSHPSVGLFRDVAQSLGNPKVRCLAGGSTVTIDGDYPVARWITRCWNLISRMTRWAPGSFIFCETAAFRSIGGFDVRLYATEEIDLFQRLKRLARQTRRRIVILRRHPLVTSARKLHLYTPREHFRFFFRTVLQGGRTLQDRAACHTWYDGRR